MTSSPTLKGVLARIEEENEEDPLWIVGPNTGRMLHSLVRVMEPEVILEIGTSVGYSALWMASALQVNGKGKLWTVESHATRFERAQKNIEEAGLGEWIMSLKGHAPEIFMEETLLPDCIDLAFFDATKKQHQEFFDAVFPRMNPGAMIVVDNVTSHRFGAMQRFISELYSRGDLQLVELSVGDGLLLARVA